MSSVDRNVLYGLKCEMFSVTVVSARGGDHRSISFGDNKRSRIKRSS